MYKFMILALCNDPKGKSVYKCNIYEDDRKGIHPDMRASFTDRFTKTLLGHGYKDIAIMDITPMHNIGD